MAGHIVKAAAVKVSVGMAGGHSLARILRRGEPIPEVGVSGEQLKHLLDRGLIAPVEDEVPAEEAPAVAPAAEGEQPEQGDDEVPDFSAMNLDQLRSYAAEHDVDLGGATRKDDIIAVLTAS